MAKRQANEEGTEGESLQSRLVAKLNKDKQLNGTLRLGSGSLLSDIPYYISTQCATLDYAISQPGIPAGRVTTIFGREGSSKSTIVQHLLAETQRMGGHAVLIDSEQRYDRDRGAKIGIDNDKLIVVQGATLEQAFDSIEKIIDGVRDDNITDPVIVVLDSLAGCVPAKRLEADVGDVLVSPVARFVGAELPRLKLKLANYGVALVIVNQIRSRVNMNADPRRAYSERMKVMGQVNSMLAEYPLLYESSLMLYVNSVQQIEDDDGKPTGIRARVTVRKCGIGPGEGRRAEYDVDYLKGIDSVGSKFELLEDLGVIKGAGGWYKLDPDIFPGEPNFRRADFASVLAAHPELETTVHEAPTLWKAS